MVYFDKSVQFPFNSLWPEGIINKVVSPVINEFNKLEFGVHFTILGYDLVDKPKSDSYIFYRYHENSACYESVTNIKVRMGLWENATIDGMQDTLKHEIIHGLGFGHKRQIIERFLAFDKGELNKDDIHGIATVYQQSATACTIFDQIDNDMSKYDERQAFLLRKKDRKLCYQSPIDITGYSEFNINESPTKFKLIYLFKKGDKFFYSKSKEKTIDIKPVDDIYSINGINWEG